MGANTKIQWADDSVNIWWGCQRHGTGCKNCYAEALASRFHPKWKLWGNSTDSARLYMPNWESTLRRLNAKAEKEGKPRVVFINSMSDFFEDFTGTLRFAGKNEETGERELFVPWHGKKKMGDGSVGRGVVMPGQMLGAGNVYRHATAGDLREEAFRVFDECPWLLFMLLTKRPENVRRMWFSHVNTDGRPPYQLRRENVWIGTAIACQEDADRNIPELLKCSDLCAKTFLSIEPMLDDIDIRKWLTWELDIDESRPPGHFTRRTTGIDWVIVGGESGPNARPCDIAWIRSIVWQCQEAGVPCFVKQLGARCVKEHAGGDAANTAYHPHGWVSQVGTAYHAGWFKFSDKKGGDPAEWPEDVRVREVPT